MKGTLILIFILILFLIGTLISWLLTLLKMLCALIIMLPGKVFDLIDTPVATYPSIPWYIRIWTTIFSMLLLGIMIPFELIMNFCDAYENTFRKHSERMVNTLEQVVKKIDDSETDLKTKNQK